jgi:dynein intermediate chain, cytosolic
MTFDEDEKVGRASEDEIRERILKEREVAEAERLKELEALSEQLDKEIEIEIRGAGTSVPLSRVRSLCGLEMTEEEKTSTLVQPEFLDFLEHSTKIIQRALNDNYDYVRDYTIGTETGPYVSLLPTFELVLYTSTEMIRKAVA